MPTFTERLKNSWNAFFNNRDPTDYSSYQYWQMSSSFRPDRVRLTSGNERSIVTSIYNRIAMDVAAVTIQHIKTDENGRFLEAVDSRLNQAFTLEANVDQTGRAFIQDVVLSMFDEGCVAIVPTDTTINPMKADSYDILEMRTAKILQWFPEMIKVRLYNERTGKREDLTLPKKMCCIIENPFYAVMNEPNSTLKRLIHKLALMDSVDEMTSSGKLDLIVQLPYVIKTEARRKQAEARRKDIEMQLSGSRYGIAYTDGTEKITQLNRSVENQLLQQIKDLQADLYSQLGLTEEIFKGTADEKAMLNYNNRTIEPILSAITGEMERKFLTKNARTRHQKIAFFMDPFRLVPLNNLAEIADKFTRNEILSSNEIRGIIGFKPSDDPKADQLVNSNLNQPDAMGMQPAAPGQEIQNGSNPFGETAEELDASDEELDDLEAEFGEPDDSIGEFDENDEIDGELDELAKEIDGTASEEELNRFSDDVDRMLEELKRSVR